MLRRPLGSFFILFLVESKSFEFIIKRGSNSFRLRIVEQGIVTFVLGRDGALWLLSTVDGRLGQKPVRDSCKSLEMLRAPSQASGVVTRMGGIWKLKSSTTVGKGDLFLSHKARRLAKLSKSSEWVKRHMYEQENFLGVSYEGFE